MNSCRQQLLITIGVVADAFGLQFTPLEVEELSCTGGEFTTAAFLNFFQSRNLGEMKMVPDPHVFHIKGPGHSCVAMLNIISSGCYLQQTQNS